MSRNNARRAEEGLSESLRREWRRDDNRRFLRAHPAFRASDGLPENLASLLERLEQAERSRSTR